MQGLTVDRGGDRDRPSAAGIDVAKRERQSLQGVGAEVIVIVEDVIMCWARRSEQPRMRLQIEIELQWMRDLLIDHGARSTITTPVRFVALAGKEAYMMALSNHNNRDVRANLEFLTGG